jgi:acetoacetyl-CoA synthetase
VEYSPDSTMTEVLTRIWQHLLQRSSIHVEDNFFDLGGNPSLAIKLFTEIAIACSRELSPVVIFHAPTIMALAALLESPSPPRFPAIVLLKAGTTEPPAFIAHGLGGSVMELFQLVECIRFEGPIYGMQAKGIDGVDQPIDRIEDMAQFYLDEIKKLQPHGPYLLIGYSFGGLVMFEMARRLSQEREKVALLTMVDTFPERRYLELEQRVRLIARLARRHASTIMRLPVRKAVSYIFRASDRQSSISIDACLTPIGTSFAPAMQRVRDSAYLALKRYRPRFYSGKINFVRSENSSELPADPAAVWAKLTNELEVETVPGDHHGILTTHFESLASALSCYLKEAFGQIRRQHRRA